MSKISDVILAENKDISNRLGYAAKNDSSSKNYKFRGMVFKYTKLCKNIGEENHE